MSRRPGILHRLLRGPVGPTVLVRLSIASVVGLTLIVPSGGLVRLTGSGLGCPDWPGCNGDIIPAMSGHAAIEYSNRVLSAIIVGIAVITWLAARRVPDAPRSLRRWALVPGAASVAQAPLGGLTVIFDLHPAFVAAHFLLSLVALAGGVVLLIMALDHRAGRERRSLARNGRAAGGMLALLTGVIVTGVLVTSAGPHSGDAAVVRRFWNVADAAAVHVRVVIAFVIAGVAFAIWLRRSGAIRDRAVRALVLIFGPLLAAQIVIGEYQYRNQLPWEVIAVHVTIAGVLAGVGVAIAWLVAHPLAAGAPAAMSATRPASQADAPPSTA